MIQTDQIEYTSQNTTMKGFIAYNQEISQPKPAVMICHAWDGRNSFVDEKAKLLANLGYVGFALDIYGNAQTGTSNDEKMALMSPFINDRTLLQQHLLAAYETIKQHKQVNPQKIAIMGYCFGGLCALDLARSGADIKAAISFHGNLTAPNNTPNATINAKVLVLHGYADPLVPPQQIHDFADEMTQAQVDWQIHMYGHTMHAFTNPAANDVDFGTVYNKLATERSEMTMRNFLSEVFNSSLK